MANKINLDITPQAYEIYGMFQNLSYTEHTAIAEFIDNSTASFYEHEQELIDAHRDTLVISINYDKEEGTLTITDDAFGMELEEFKRAILLGRTSPTRSGRNEFGLGLKTAATWFGRHWSVESTQYGSINNYFAYIDIDELVHNRASSIKIEQSTTKAVIHGTVITISKLTKELSSTKIKNRIIKLLNNTYRRDLKNGKISIIFNGTTLSYTPIKPLENFRGKTWAEPLNFSFDHAGKIYTVTGMVGIMNKGEYDRSGFALFRRNRVIKSDYKPESIYGHVKHNQIDLKLYGELNLDDFPINQAKDGFQWSADLEEKLEVNLKAAIADYIEVAKMKRADILDEIDRANALTPDNPDVQSGADSNSSNATDKNLNSDNVNMDNSSNNKIDLNKTSFIESGKEDDLVEAVANEANDKASSNENINQGSSNTAVNAGSTGTTVLNANAKDIYTLKCGDSVMAFEWKLVPNKFSLYVKKDGKYFINLNHKFAKECSIAARLEVTKIIYAYILAEQDANRLSDDGMASTTLLHIKMSDNLLEIKEI